MNGLPRCAEADNIKGLWNPGDPKEGINFHAFMQTRSDVGLLGSCAETNAIKIKLLDTLPARCYSYKYLNAVCIIIKYQEGTDVLPGTWEYVNGCFADGSPVEYLPAETGKTINFNHLRIEVRQAND